VGTTLFNKLDF